jgi:CysZ protein
VAQALRSRDRGWVPTAPGAMLGVMQELATGVRDIGRGFGVLNAHPGLWKWVAAPAVATAALAVALIAGIVRLVDPVNAWVARHLPDAIAQVASSILTTLVVIVLAAGALLVFVPLAGIVAGPFNEMLSERVEAKLTGKPAPGFSLSELARGLVLGIGHGLRRLLTALVGFALVVAVGLVPVIGAVAAPVLAVWLTASSAAYDCYDAVFSRRTMAYGDKLAFLARHRSRTLGLGGGVAAMLLVPGVNLLALGIGAAGATVGAHAIGLTGPASHTVAARR